MTSVENNTKRQTNLKIGRGCLRENTYSDLTGKNLIGKRRYSPAIARGRSITGIIFGHLILCPSNELSFKVSLAKCFSMRIVAWLQSSGL